MLIGTANIDELAAHARRCVERLDGEPVTLRAGRGAAGDLRDRRAAPRSDVAARVASDRSTARDAGSSTAARRARGARSPWRRRASSAAAACACAPSWSPRSSTTPTPAPALGSRWGFAVQVGRIDLHRYYDSIARAGHGGPARHPRRRRLGPRPPLRGGRAVRGQHESRAHAARSASRASRAALSDAARRARPPAGRGVRRDGVGRCPHPSPSIRWRHRWPWRDITIPRLRFVCRPDVLAFDGTEAAG